MRIDAARFMNIKPEVLELLKNMEIGDVLKGRVLEALGNNITVRAASGQVFTALLQEGATVPKGALVELLVSNIADGKIYAEFKTGSKATDMDAKITDLLMQFGLPVEEKNMEAAKLLIKYQLPLDKDSVVKITGLQKSIENLNQTGEEKVGLLLSGLDIKNTPVDVLNKIVLGWSGEMLKQDTAGVSAAIQNNTAEDNIPAEENLQGAVKNTGDKVTVDKAPGEPEKQLIMNKGKMEVTQKEITELPKMAKIDSKEASTELGMIKEPIIREIVESGSKGSSPITDDDKGAELLKVLAKLGVESGNEVKRLAGQVEDILASIRNTDMEALTYLVSKEMKITPGNLGMLIRNIENSDGISQFLDKLQKRTEGEDAPELREIKESIKKIFLEPRQLEKSKETAEQLKDIARLGEKLESYLNKSGDKDPEIRDALSNLRDSIDFLRNINEHSNFMQFPVMINENTSTAKLYIFKEGKRSKQINPEDATVVLSLDLKSLGHLESMIKVKGKSVNITFRVENEGIGTILEKNGSLLKDSLNEKGYSLNPVRVISMEQPFSLLSLEAMINESSSDKIHFDMRV